MNRLLRGLLVTIIAFTLAFGAFAARGSGDASAAWTGYWTWTYNAQTHQGTWVWIWVWYTPASGFTVS